ncbi:hypothetical protein ACS0TY_002614 [Phlomoides rotata]
MKREGCAYLGVSDQNIHKRNWVWNLDVTPKIKEVQHLSHLDDALFAALLWSTWFARNEKVFRDRMITGQSILDIALHHLDDFCSAKVLCPTPGRGTNQVRWVAPERGVLKLNSDAAGIGVGMGGVVCDEQGVVFVGVGCQN